MMHSNRQNVVVIDQREKEKKYRTNRYKMQKQVSRQQKPKINLTKYTDEDATYTDFS